MRLDTKYESYGNSSIKYQNFLARMLNHVMNYFSIRMSLPSTIYTQTYEIALRPQGMYVSPLKRP